MLSNSLKTLVKHAGNVFTILADTAGCDVNVTITTLDGQHDEYIEDIVSISLPSYYNDLTWEFLEPLSNYAIAKNIGWTIRTDKDSHNNQIFIIDLYH